eukprot:6173962-Pleurochrysis_carterae.AAC.1
MHRCKWHRVAAKSVNPPMYPETCLRKSQDRVKSRKCAIMLNVPPDFYDARLPKLRNDFGKRDASALYLSAVYH